MIVVDVERLKMGSATQEPVFFVPATTASDFGVIPGLGLAAGDWPHRQLEKLVRIYRQDMGGSMGSATTIPAS